MKYFPGFSHKFFTSGKRHLISAFFIFGSEKQHLIPEFFFVETQCLAWRYDHFLLLTSFRKHLVHGVMTFFLEITLQVTEDTGSVLWLPFFLRSPCFWDRLCEKAASRSLSYGFFAKTSVHFRTFSSVYTKGEKLEGTQNRPIVSCHMGNLCSHKINKKRSLCNVHVSSFAGNQINDLYMVYKSIKLHQ